MFKSIILISSTVLLLQGCNNTSVKPDAENVKSTPLGATVYANNQKLGITPLHHDLYEAFPAVWKNSEYQAQGVLTLKKAGCEDFSIEVSDLLLSNPIHAELKCDDAINSKITDFSSSSKNTIAKRLTEAELLFKQGVITEDEYKAARKRILTEL